MTSYTRLNLNEVLNKIFKIKNGTEWIINQRLNKKFIILLLIFSVASFILIPGITYGYRLYYYFPLLMILWKESGNIKKVKFYALLSIVFFIIKGFWMPPFINPFGFDIFDARFTNVFLILSFYFAIKAGINLVMEKRIQPAMK
jgi:hypothetical protein